MSKDQLQRFCSNRIVFEGKGSGGVVNLIESWNQEVGVLHPSLSADWGDSLQTLSLCVICLQDC